MCQSGPLYVYKDYNYKAKSFPDMRAESPVRKGLPINPQRRAHMHVCSRSSFVMRENRVSVESLRTFPDDGSVRVFICSCGETIWLKSGDTNLVARKRSALVAYPARLTPGLQEF
jgi:predicted Rdx family selenoprotein